ncbi:MAG TPA: nucleoside deaminase [Nitrosospira sp.]|nr:nucleoside deaminase [Nitrosospira sp.]
MSNHETLLREALRLAKNNREQGQRPFGAVLAMNGEIVSTGVNDVLRSNDPTTHAEMEAVRAASRRLKRPDLKGSTVYASGHPCPMCLAAMVVAGVDAVYYAFDNDDAEPYGFSSNVTYEKLRLPLSPPPLPLIRINIIGVTAAEVYG